MTTDYTQLFEKIQMKGQIPEFPLDLLNTTLTKQMQGKGKAKAFIYEHPTMATTTPRKIGPAFVYGGDCVSVPTFGIAVAGPTKDDVQIAFDKIINGFCEEMIQFEQKHGFLSSKDCRIIVSMYDISIHDDTVIGGYYGWDEVGFLILRK